MFNIVVCCLYFEAAAMRRWDNSLVSEGTVYSSSQKADKMANVLHTVEIDSNEFVDFGPSDDKLLENTKLEPKLHAIFADVANKLPSIDFDMSDVSHMSPLSLWK